MAYTSTTWVNGTTPLNATHLNNLETQYTESSLSFEPDQFTAGFVITGYAASGTVGTTTVNVAAGTAYLLQTDGTTRQRKLTSSTQTTSTPSTTYHLYLQPDGTWFWSTAGSGQQTNSLHIADVATNGSGQISSITDFRPLNPILFPSLSSYLELPVGFVFGGLASLTSTSALQAGLYVSTGINSTILTAPLSGTANGIVFVSWDGAARHFPLSVGGLFASAQAYFDQSGNLSGPSINGIAGSLTVSSLQSGSASGVVFNSWTGAAGSTPFSIGGQINSASTYIKNGGAFGGVAGVATSGQWGVPVVTADAIETNVINSSLTTIATYTVPANASLVRVWGRYFVGSGNTNAGTCTLEFTYTDPRLGAVTGFFWVLGTATQVNALSTAKGQLNNCVQSQLSVTSGSTITIKYQNSAAGTISDFVSATIEAIA